MQNINPPMRIHYLLFPTVASPSISRHRIPGSQKAVLERPDSPHPNSPNLWPPYHPHRRLQHPQRHRNKQPTPSTSSIMPAFRRRLPFPRLFNQTSYSRGATIIDYCFLSTEFLPCIRACGYLPLHFFSYSDRRSLYVDFNSVTLFGGSPPKIPKPTARFVKSRDSQSTVKFLQRLQIYWAEHSLSARVTRLANTLQCTTTASAPARRLAQKIDRDRTRGFLKSERKCHRPNRPPWSRPLHRLSRQFCYWQIFFQISSCEDIATTR